MNEYSSISSSAFDITIASTPCVSSSNWNVSISSSSEEEDAIPSSAYSLSKRHLLNWLGDQRNTLWDWMINWWKVVWG